VIAFFRQHTKLICLAAGIVCLLQGIESIAAAKILQRYRINPDAIHPPQEIHHPFCCKYCRIISAAVAPSPAAEAACLVEPARTSPAANNPGMEVINVLSVTTEPH
jgi:hypothetical protein